MSMSASKFGMFQGFGVELEYMIVDSETQAVKPVADQLLRVGDGYESEVEHGPLAWSNELVLHVVELKTNGPATGLHGLAAVFQDHVRDINRLLQPLHACLLPTAMHPTMDPQRETVLWPHDHNEVYATFNRIFDCSGHGWSNLQSVHINLPFKDDKEFARLHAAIRLVLPIVPALAASSPVTDGTIQPWLDTRMEMYSGNSARIPSVTGLVIPESVASRAEYEKRILAPIYSDLAPYDSDGIVRYEWSNARGAIARFERNTIEIRVVDSQEYPLADLAVVAAIVGVVRSLTDERHATLSKQQQVGTEALAAILRQTIEHAEEAVITDRDYLTVLGLDPASTPSAGDVWGRLIETDGVIRDDLSEWSGPLETILKEGCLARRILKRLGDDLSADRIRAVYGELADCLAQGELFHSSAQ